MKSTNKFKTVNGNNEATNPLLSTVDDAIIIIPVYIKNDCVEEVNRG